MIIIKALLLFLLYDGTFSQEEPSEACQNITAELNATQACQDAIMAVAINNGTSNLARSDLEAYCTQDCRDVVEGIAAAECGDDSETDNSIPVSAQLQLVCSVNSDGQLCSEFQEVDTSFLLTCGFGAAGGTCPEGCDMTIQEFVDSLGCCYHLLLPVLVPSEFSAQATALLQLCNVNIPPEQPPCQIVGESSDDDGGNDSGGDATNLKAFGLGVVLCVATVASFFE